jgi:hypothetical protein
MKLSPGQIREILGLSQDTYRHWKKALPPLTGRNGYRPCFTTGDLFAMALVRALTEDAGVQISALSTVSMSLFDYCGQHSWAELERSTLVHELSLVRARFFAESHRPELDGVGIVAPCRPIVADLRERLLLDKEDAEQGNLRFPPTVVLAGGRGRRAS